MTRRLLLVLLTALGVVAMHGAPVAHAAPVSHLPAMHAGHHAPADGPHDSPHHVVAPCVAALPSVARPAAPAVAVVVAAPEAVAVRSSHPVAALPPDGAHAPPDLSALCISRT